MVRLVRFNREPAFNDLFNRFFENEFINSDYVPATNINETDENFELSMLIPGIKKEQVNISLEDNLLTVSAEVEKKEEDENGWRKEFIFQSFNRSFRLPKTVDAEAIKAEQTDGVLRIQIPKKKEEQKLKKLIAIS